MGQKIILILFFASWVTLGFSQSRLLPIALQKDIFVLSFSNTYNLNQNKIATSPLNLEFGFDYFYEFRKKNDQKLCFALGTGYNFKSLNLKGKVNIAEGVGSFSPYSNTSTTKLNSHNLNFPLELRLYTSKGMKFNLGADLNIPLAMNYKSKSDDPKTRLYNYTDAYPNLYFGLGWKDFQFFVKANAFNWSMLSEDVQFFNFGIKISG